MPGRRTLGKLCSLSRGRAGEVLDDGREYDMGELLSAALRMIFAAARKG